MIDVCEYCGMEVRYGHTAVCVVNTVDEQRAEIERQDAEIARLTVALRQENERLTANIVDISAECRRLMVENKRQKTALESLTKDPPATLSREPDTDAEVIIKMRAIALGAITNGYPSGEKQ